MLVSYDAIVCNEMHCLVDSERRMSEALAPEQSPCLVWWEQALLRTKRKACYKHGDNKCYLGRKKAILVVMLSLTM